MTATMTPPPPAAPLEADPLRLLPVTANLLPPEITDARRLKKTRRMVAVVVGLAVIATGGWYLVARHSASNAQGSLTAAQDRSLNLTRKEASYKKLVQVQSQTTAISNELSALMADDLPWWQLMPSLGAIAPAGVRLTSVTGSTTTSAAAAQPSAAPAAGTGDATPIGTFTIIGTAPDKNSIAAFVDSLATVKGIANPYLTGAQAQSGGTLQFTIQVQITKAALGGRYATATPTPKASH